MSPKPLPTRARLIEATRPAIFAVLACLVPLSAGCGGPLDVKPGLHAYPKLNPDPHKRIRFVLSGARPQDVKVLLDYETSAPILGCYTQVGLAENSMLSVTVPLNLSEQHDGSHAAYIYTDKFQPGRCRWALAGITVDVPIAQFHELTPLAGFLRSTEEKNKTILAKSIYHSEWHCPKIGHEFCVAPRPVPLPAGWPENGYGEIHWDIKP